MDDDFRRTAVKSTMRATAVAPHGHTAPVLPELLLCGILSAQTSTGELRLAVRDRSGAGFAAVAELSNQATHTRHKVTLSSSGRYTFKALPFGSYQLVISQPGFQPSSETIDIRSEVPQEHVVTLGLAQQRQSVEVSDSDTLLDTDRVGASYYVGSEQITQRPLNLPGRGLIDLIAEQPGWTLEANGILHPRES